jgi:hypothetical protein
MEASSLRLRRRCSAKSPLSGCFLRFGRLFQDASGGLIQVQGQEHRDSRSVCFPFFTPPDPNSSHQTEESWLTHDADEVEIVGGEDIRNSTLSLCTVELRTPVVYLPIKCRQGISSEPTKFQILRKLTNWFILVRSFMTLNLPETTVWLRGSRMVGTWDAEVSTAISSEWSQ